jgi:hypothetical protein
MARSRFLAGTRRQAHGAAPSATFRSIVSFRTWEHTWTPPRPGRHVLAVRATDRTGDVQPDAPVWNPGGYLWNRVERQPLVVGAAS